ncbi:MAG: AzlD family protein, partial [Desulfovibrionaceae bacterium]|nr:AzlD family protein [Desulfovibrionaceae bacterium]
ITIVLMACTTYLTRVLGYLALHNRKLSPRMRAVMEAIPGCVLVSVVAPYFASGEPADLCALTITLICAIRLPFLATVLIGIGSAALLRQMMVF